MSSPRNFAAMRARTQADPHRILRASLPLLVLLDKSPRADNPRHITVACWQQAGVDGMVVHLSPVDAMLDMQRRNRTAHDFHVADFEAVDPRDFVHQHNGWLTVYLSYGYAARGERLLQDTQGNPLPLMQGVFFHFADDLDHFHLKFGEKILNWLDGLYEQSHMPPLGHLLDQLEQAPVATIKRHVDSALVHANWADPDNIEPTHCGLYDPFAKRWRFTALANHVLQRAV